MNEHVSDRTVKILLVDDNMVDQEAVRRAFVRHRIANPLLVAHDGVEALRVLRGVDEQNTGLHRPYIVLLDLNMPRMGGIEFLDHVRDDPKLRDIVVFVLTTSKSDEDKLASYDHNIAGYIVKDDVGPGFQRLVDLLQYYWRIVELPPERG